MDEDYIVDQIDPGMSFSVHFTTYEPIELESFSIPAGDTAAVLNLLERIERSHLKKGTNAESLYLLYKLFSLFGEIYGRKYHPTDKKLMSAKEYMNLHFKEDDCIVKAAEEYGVTQRRFCEIVHRLLVPVQYIRLFL